MSIIYHPICANFGCNEKVRFLKSGKLAMHCSVRCTNTHNSLKANEKRIQTWANKSKEETDLATERRKTTCKELYGCEFIHSS